MLFSDVPQRRLVATDVSRQPINSIFRDQEVLRRRWLTTGLHCVTDQKGEDLTPRQKSDVKHIKYASFPKRPGLPLSASSVVAESIREISALFNNAVNF
jgi:hypothetical protein